MAVSVKPAGRASWVTSFRVLTWRAVATTWRVPSAWIPGTAIALFFLFVYNGSLSKLVDIPGFGTDNYLGFILPVAIVSAAVGGAGSSGQSIVRDLENGYFDKLLLTPASRAAIVLGPMLAGALQLALQVVLLIIVGKLLGLHSATGPGGYAVVLILALFWGLAFAGYSVGVALRSGNGQAAQAATFVFFPLIFLSTTFVPKDLLGAGWIKFAATINPTTYVFEGMRSVLLDGWQTIPLVQGFGAVVIFATLTWVFAARSAIAATRRG
ncbi:ABC transporter permease [Rubrobacter calidifluminis]|uniref:ABC transporter permease n=1 Tax=Rubrobacter calidifluminis TaxID=1392640 RepID=UPI00235F8B7B|nr:ABC transporter permease [Rubrobacter calidifluminis]